VHRCARAGPLGGPQEVPDPQVVQRLAGVAVLQYRAVFGDGAGPGGTDADDGGARPDPDTRDGTSGESDVTGTDGRSGADAGDGALT
ncbi:hypothetical protein, partial [Streptomyces massasporeus]|uniref:hypothetical protein n=1 Tax=Streptomyces massasporeus TaxID=67324 RepID=UPI003330C709